MTNNTSIESIAAEKARLADALRKLEAQEVELLKQQVVDAHASVKSLLGQFGKQFTARQTAELAALLGSPAPALKARRGSNKRKGEKVAPKYWLPHSGETWTGRGRTPKLFEAWQGTAAYKEWKARHPDEKFPKFPG